MCACLSVCVCVYVCLSQAGIVSKWLHRSNGFYCMQVFPRPMLHCVLEKLGIIKNTGTTPGTFSKLWTLKKLPWHVDGWSMRHQQRQRSVCCVQRHLASTAEVASNDDRGLFIALGVQLCVRLKKLAIDEWRQVHSSSSQFLQFLLLHVDKPRDHSTSCQLTLLARFRDITRSSAT